MEARSEVKGVWFATAKKYASEKFGPLAVADLIANVGPACAEVLTHGIASAWYPEEIFGEALAGIRHVLAGDDSALFVRVMEEATLVGVNRFISSLIGKANPAFVMRRVPAMWAHVRRGPAVVTVDATDAGAEVHYSQFPYFGDENYVYLTQGSLRALVAICQRTANVRIASHGRTHLSLAVTWSARGEASLPI